MTGGRLVLPEMLISGGLLTGNGTITATGVCNTGGRQLDVPPGPRQFAV
jgi:hypothetical protein